MQSWAVGIRSVEISDTDLAHRLRTGSPAVVARLHEGFVLFDLRTVFPEQESALVDAIRAALTTAV